MINNAQNSVKKLVQVSLLIALAIVIRNFSYMFYIGGAPGMRFSFSDVFTKITAILFGPFYGGAASGIVDIVGFMMNPQGAYIPLLTVTAVLSGVLTGVIWHIAGKVNFKEARKYFLIGFLMIGIIGVINHLAVALIPESFWGRTIVGIGKNRDFATVGLEAIAIIGLCLIGINLIIKKINTKWTIQEEFLKILIAVGASGLTISTLNTLILQQSIPELGKIPFLVFWIPRIIKEIFMVVIQSYMISFLLSIYKRFRTEQTAAAANSIK